MKNNLRRLDFGIKKDIPVFGSTVANWLGKVVCWLMLAMVDDGNG